MSEQTLQDDLRYYATQVMDDNCRVEESDLLFKVCDRLAELERQLAEAQKDQARLEWMMNNSAYMAYSMDGEVCHVRITAERGEDEYPAEGYPLKVYDDRRQAIDAAIAQQKVGS